MVNRVLSFFSSKAFAVGAGQLFVDSIDRHVHLGLVATCLIECSLLEISVEVVDSVLGCVVGEVFAVWAG